MKKTNYTAIEYFTNDQLDLRKEEFHRLLRDYLIKSSAKTDRTQQKTKP